MRLITAIGGIGVGSKPEHLWKCDAKLSTWPIFVFRDDDDEKCPIWVWGDIRLANRICRLLNGRKMNKLDRWQRIKQIYPAACRMDHNALKELERLVKQSKRLDKCSVCKSPIKTEKRPGEDIRCQPHRKSNCCMKKPKMLKAVHP